MQQKLQTIWAKKSEGKWLPLYVHMSDTAGVAENLWDKWASDSVKRKIKSDIECSDDNIEIRNILAFLAAIHDIGKCTPAFQVYKLDTSDDFRTMVINNLEKNGLQVKRNLNNVNNIPHAVASQYILELNGFDRSMSLIVGSHHGKTPGHLIDDVDGYPNQIGFKNAEWMIAWNELIRYACDISHIEPESIKSIKADTGAQVLLMGLLIMADWLSSNENYFPLSEKQEYSEDELASRIRNGWRSCDLPAEKSFLHDIKGDDLFESRFGFKPRPFQKSLCNVAENVSEPGLYIIEAPMGEGKTEAALCMAEILGSKFGLNGIFFALPTCATSDGIFPRIKSWLLKMGEDGTCRTITLFHGKSKFNTEYSTIPKSSYRSSDDRVIIHEWMCGKKKAILSDFVIGTVDQVLMASLKRRHLALRHLGLSNKIVIVDECHAYDAYMGSYLSRCLEWLGSYGIPVILMSATLPPSLRQQYMNSYLGKKNDDKDTDWKKSKEYPIITYSEKKSICQCELPNSGRKTEVIIKKISDDDAMLDCIDSLFMKDGGYVGVIVNTVNRSQNLASTFISKYGCDKVKLLHSRFTAIDRSWKEHDLIESMNKNRCMSPNGCIVVGTQVIEQSLDIDFDVLFTDICPMDLLIQRIGRLHRHSNFRPESMKNPVCYVVDTKESWRGSSAVYGEYQLYNTRLILPEKMSLPLDIPSLVHKAYGREMDVPDCLKSDYERASDESNRMMEDKKKKAKQYQICRPTDRSEMIRWLEDDWTPSDEISAMAAVRDTDETIDAILVGLDHNKEYRIITSKEDVFGKPIDRSITSEQAFELAGCKVSLSGVIRRSEYDKFKSELINEQDEIPESWKESEWLHNELFLVLKEEVCSDNMHFVKMFMYRRLEYDLELGLMVREHE